MGCWGNGHGRDAALRWEEMLSEHGGETEAKKCSVPDSSHWKDDVLTMAWPWSQTGCSEKRAFSGVIFFLEGFYFSHKLAPCAAGVAQRGPHGNHSRRWLLSAAVLRPKTLQIYSLTCSETLRPLLSSSHELSSRDC